MNYSTVASSGGTDQSSDYVQGLVYQLADLAHLLSYLKEYVPLTQIKDKCDKALLIRLKEPSMQENLCSILKNRLDHGYTDVDISTALHYMALVSSESQFGIDFQKLNVYGIIKCFNECESQFNIPVDIYQTSDLDQQVLYNLACFEFLQHYKETFKFIFPDSFNKIFCNEQTRIYAMVIPTQSRFYNFISQIQEQLLYLLDFIMTTTTEHVVITFQNIDQLIYLIECLLKTIKEYKQITNQSIRLDLKQLSGMIMFLAIQLSEFVKYTDFMQQFYASHIQVIQRIINCLDYLWCINSKFIQPIGIADSTPLSSPQGRLVTYNQGLIPCLLEMFYNIMKLNIQCDGCELGLVTNLLHRIIVQDRGVDIHTVVSRSKQEVSQKLTSICNYLNQKSTPERTDYYNVCSYYADILVSFTKAKIYLSFNSILKFLGELTMGGKGTKQLKQKCSYLLGKLQSRAESQLQELQANYDYKSGQDKYLDYVLLKKQQNQRIDFTE